MDSWTPEEENLLGRFVSNVESNIFVLHNLPEVVKGALFSRYSRSTLSLKNLLLKEFLTDEHARVHEMNLGFQKVQMEAIQKAQSFYDRILDGYGDDSIGELGGAHLAVEKVSMLAAKAIEDCRIGGSPLEKSTRYVYFDQKNSAGEYAYYRDSVIMTSAYKDLYLRICDALFETYTDLVKDLSKVMENLHPRAPDTPNGVYRTTIRGKVLDLLRGLLPAGTFTNMGLFGNGRFYEGMLRKMHVSGLTELQEIGKKAQTELEKIIPSFVRRALPAHKNQTAYQDYIEKLQGDLSEWNDKHVVGEDISPGYRVRLLGASADAVREVAVFLLYEHGHSDIASLRHAVRAMPDEEIRQLFDLVVEGRQNRRHKSPRGLEHATFTFEIVSDFGVYRDLQRHRMLTQQRQQLTCDLGYFIPREIIGTAMEEKYRTVMEEAKKAYDRMRGEFSEEAQYIVPMGYNIAWYFHINLRALQWLSELRSMQQGHETYRKVAQDMARHVQEAFPQFAPFFGFVDWNGSNEGRLQHELYHAHRKNNIGLL